MSRVKYSANAEKPLYLKTASAPRISRDTSLPTETPSRSLFSYCPAIANSGLSVLSKSPSLYFTSPHGWYVTRALY
ncbi:hypothetical protein D3C83_168960 [compost metagenome]